MKIGIIVYSKTGNTLFVAERIREELTQNGHTVTIERFTALTEPQSNKPVSLSNVPNPNVYDAVIFGAPVQAFSLDPAMTLYFKQAGALKIGTALCFVTQHFKKPWLGGNRAIKQLIAQLREKGIASEAVGIVNWSSEEREAQIALIAKRCVEMLRVNSK